MTAHANYRREITLRPRILGWCWRCPQPTYTRAAMSAKSSSRTLPGYSGDRSVIGGQPNSSPRSKAENHPMTSVPGGQVETTYGYAANKDDYAKRLRRVEGQIRGIAKMIDEDKYCIDILTQISAVNSALQSVALGLLEEHLNHCVTNAVSAGGEEADAKLAEASAAIARLVRS